MLFRSSLGLLLAMPSKSQAATFREAVRAIVLLKEIAVAISAGDFKRFTKADFTARYTRLEHHRSKLEDVFHEILDDVDLSEETEMNYTKNYESAINDYNGVLV